MFKLRPAAILAGSCLIGLAAPAWAQDSGVTGSGIEIREVEAIMADLDALKMPQFDNSKREDREYISQYIQARDEYQQRRSELAMDLFWAAPNHPQLSQLMNERWSTLERQREFDKVIAETARIAETDSAIATDAAYHHALAIGGSKEWNIAETMPAIDAFIASAPGDERGANLLNSAARYAQGADDQKMLYQRMVDDFPEARASKYAPGKLKMLGGVGKPFELEFQNAVNGETINLADHKGTVFVIDFWATWCGPCVAEMPHMKELYAEYKGKGVEFVGISLDQPKEQGGLDKLLAYVETNEVGWPQYYQGAGWDGEFSKSWGINSIPALFVVDADGNLYSTNARGKLEQFLPELIAKRDAKH